MTAKELMEKLEGYDETKEVYSSYGLLNDNSDAIPSSFYFIEVPKNKSKQPRLYQLGAFGAENKPLTVQYLKAVLKHFRKKSLVYLLPSGLPNQGCYWEVFHCSTGMPHSDGPVYLSICQHKRWNVE